jgi:hypothetical protein
MVFERNTDKYIREFSPDFSVFINNGKELQSYVMFHLLWRGENHDNFKLGDNGCG